MSWGEGAPSASGPQPACFCLLPSPSEYRSGHPCLLEMVERFSHLTLAGLLSRRRLAPHEPRPDLQALCTRRTSPAARGPTNRPRLPDPGGATGNTSASGFATRVSRANHGQRVGERARGMKGLVVGAPAGLRHPQCPGRSDRGEVTEEAARRGASANRGLGRAGPWRNRPRRGAGGTTAPTVPRAAGSPCGCAATPAPSGWAVAK